MSITRPKLVIIIVGVGNIGSYAAPLVARIPGLGLVVLIDKDSYEESNLAGQDITRKDVGKTKVEVIGRRLRRINPELKIVTIARAVEDLPLGMIRSTVLLGCVDSRKTRLYLSEMAWSLGVPYIDAGVEPDGLLARLNVFIPGRNSPCYQCGWQQSDYAAVEQTYPCSGGSVPQARTNGVASLGSLAASLQVIEGQKLLSGRPLRVLNGEELMIDASWHRYYVTARRRSPACRFCHEVWKLEMIDQGAGRLTMAKAFALVIPAHGEGPSLDSKRQLRNGELSLRVPGHHFISMMTCKKCGRRQAVLRLVRRLRPSDRKCDGCGKEEMDALTADMSERLLANRLSPSELSLTLQSIGLEAGDVFSVGYTVGQSTTERHFQIALDQCRKL